MNNSSRFFANTECEYYPCHRGLKQMNCLFCYCPFFLSEKCPGGPIYWEADGGKIIKDCSECVFPHIPGNYDRVIAHICRQVEDREYSEKIKKKAKKIPERTGD